MLKIFSIAESDKICYEIVKTTDVCITSKKIKCSPTTGLSETMKLTSEHKQSFLSVHFSD